MGKQLFRRDGLGPRREEAAPHFEGGQSIQTRPVGLNVVNTVVVEAPLA